MNRNGHQGIAPRLRVGLTAAVVVIAALQAGCASSLKIRDLLENPARYYGLDLDADITETPAAA